MNPSNVHNLLTQKFLLDYDSTGKQPTCSCTCAFHCQAKFKYDSHILTEELQKWWGDDSNNVLRDSYLYDDLKNWSIKNEDGSYKLRWFIRNKQVCLSFYLRARGLTHSHVQKLQKQFLNENRTYISAVMDRYDRTKARTTPKKDLVIAWLSVFKKEVGGERLPDEDFVVLPYKDIAPIYEEYKEDVESLGSPLAGKPAGPSHFYEIFNKVSKDLRIRLQRDTGTLARCSICDAYATHLRGVKTWEHRQQIKDLRTKHLEKQRKQREKYYKHSYKAMKAGGRKRYLSIIMDGMDQKKTNVPVMATNTKDEPPLVQRIIGVKVHGLRNYCFIVDENIPGGANF